MYEFRTTSASITWEAREPQEIEVVVPEGVGWDLVSSAAVSDDGYDAIFWTWRRPKMTQQKLV